MRSWGKKCEGAQRGSSAFDRATRFLWRSLKCFPDYGAAVGRAHSPFRSAKPVDGRLPFPPAQGEQGSLKGRRR